MSLVPRLPRLGPQVSLPSNPKPPDPHPGDVFPLVIWTSERQERQNSSQKGQQATRGLPRPPVHQGRARNQAEWVILAEPFHVKRLPAAPSVTVGSLILLSQEGTEPDPSGSPVPGREQIFIPHYSLQEAPHPPPKLTQSLLCLPSCRVGT